MRYIPESAHIANEDSFLAELENNVFAIIIEMEEANIKGLYISIEAELHSVLIRVTYKGSSYLKRYSKITIVNYPDIFVRYLKKQILNVFDMQVKYSEDKF